MATRLSSPRATYRLQLNKDFTFRDAAKIAPYLARLGISHLYLSPILKARPGSLHGYDVTDHANLNPELGALEDFKSFAARAREHGLNLIVDVVPNHMAIMADDNLWWLDVLENGPIAEHAGYFDIDWLPIRPSMANRLLLPVLGEQYGQVLDKGEIKVVFHQESGAFSLCYYEHRFPIDPREYPRVFADRKEELKALNESDPLHAQDFESLLEQFARLPSRNEISDAARIERYRDKEVYKRRLTALCIESPALKNCIEQAVAAINGEPGRPDSFDSLHALIEAQAYRLAYWRVAGDEINYRRFFDVDHLAALRMDDEKVFEATHRLLLEWVADGDISGFRIDHPDGLYDPQAYLERLQRGCSVASGQQQPFYIVVEKILAIHERLNEQWPVAGTTGYDFAALANAWLTDSDSERPFNRIYEGFTQRTHDYGETLYESKKLTMRTLLAAEIAVLSTQLDRLAQQRRYTADFTRYALRDAVIETIACFPIYRTYVSERGASLDDARHIEWALQVARKRSQAADLSVFDFLRQVLLEDARDAAPSIRTAALEFAQKFQQVSSAVTAKGMEDTAFYRYARLVSLNEVGCSPLRFGLSNASLHQANSERAKRWPQAMLGTSTHDSKRSEDVRARIAVLSEAPHLWRQHLARWSRLHRGKRGVLNEEAVPSRNDEYFLYQTLLGMWPTRAPDAHELESLRTRIKEYAIKAAREAKVHTSWINPQPAYEEALQAFAERILERPERNAFLRDLNSLVATAAYFGVLNSLSQTILKIASPGVPDFYQGSELPQLTLVDPDNRHPVDFAEHEQALSSLEQGEGAPQAERLAELLRNWPDGRIKLFVTWQLLQLRARKAALFTEGKYEPLRVQGQHAERVLAFSRSYQDELVIFVVPRHFSKLAKGELKPPLGIEVWEDTLLDLSGVRAGRFLEIFTKAELDIDGRSCLEVGKILQHFPFAVLALSDNP